MSRVNSVLRRLIARVLKGLAGRPPLRRMLLNPWLEHALCLQLLPGRMRLERVELSSLFAGADSIPVAVDRVPDGPWRTQLDDLVWLIKIARATSAASVLELGSYRGVTAAYLARNLPDGGRIVAVDIDPDHGAAYRGTALEGRIERRTGAIGPALFRGDPPESYDLIFVDASHAYDDVRRDTEIALGLIARGGHIVWHDYSNFGYFNGHSEVPEFLNDLATSKPVLALAGSTLAIHSPAWSRDPPSASRSATIRA